jgi:hypothetical protein
MYLWYFTSVVYHCLCGRRPVVGLTVAAGIIRFQACMRVYYTFLFWLWTIITVFCALRRAAARSRMGSRLGQCLWRCRFCTQHPVAVLCLKAIECCCISGSFARGWFHCISGPWAELVAPTSAVSTQPRVPRLSHQTQAKHVVLRRTPKYRCSMLFCAVHQNTGAACCFALYTLGAALLHLWALGRACCSLPPCHASARGPMFGSLNRVCYAGCCYHFAAWMLFVQPGVSLGLPRAPRFTPA